MKPKKKLKLAVVGVGSLGQHHARVYSEMEDVALVAVVDSNMARAKEIASKYDCLPFDRIDPLIGRIDAASIVVPTAHHHPVAKVLLNQGVHLLLEKPMTNTLEEADDLIGVSERSAAMLQIGHIEQFNAGFRTLKKYLQQPRFFECHRIGPFVARGTDVHVILDLMIHDIDIILSLLTAELTEIRAVGTSVLTPQIDIANVRLAFSDGCVANITASRVSQDKLRKIRVFQSDAYFSLDYMRQEMRVYRRVLKTDGTPSIEISQVAAEKEESLKAELSSFVRSIRSQAGPHVSGEDGRRALEVALRIVDLIKNGQSSLP
ncbi:MAG: Gfo/Idh/MocA family protein [Nitrospiria bacterium]